MHIHIDMHTYIYTQIATLKQRVQKYNEVHDIDMTELQKKDQAVVVCICMCMYACMYVYVIRDNGVAEEGSGSGGICMHVYVCMYACMCM